MRLAIVAFDRNIGNNPMRNHAPSNAVGGIVGPIREVRTRIADRAANIGEGFPGELAYRIPRRMTRPRFAGETASAITNRLLGWTWGRS